MPLPLSQATTIERQGVKNQSAVSK